MHQLICCCVYILLSKFLLHSYIVHLRPYYIMDHTDTSLGPFSKPSKYVSVSTHYYLDAVVG